MSLKIGDKVYTKKGDRYRENPGILVVTKINKKWGKYEAVICLKLDGSKRLFLVKNLVKVL